MSQSVASKAMTLDERIEVVLVKVNELEKVIEAFAIECDKRFDEIQRDLEFIVSDARAKNERISLLETRLGVPLKSE
jgi:hypothetical protein